MPRIFLTLAIVLLAVACAAGVAYGTDPRWMARARGLDWIMLGRRWQWPMAAGSLIACVVLIGMVIAGKRTVFWLVALAPVLLLFYQRFMSEPWRRVGVADAPPMVEANRATFLQGDDAVIGLTFEDMHFAYPCAALARTPIVLHADGDRRLIVLYSPVAGRAGAASIDHTIKGRELEVVSMPAGAALILNGRIGQFVNGFTGLTPDGKRPTGFGPPIDTVRTTWAHWRARHPDSRVLATAGGTGETAAPPITWPEPAGGWAVPPSARVALLATTRPLAVRGEDVRPGDVVNVSAGGMNLLLIRDTAGTLHAYDRTVKGDLFPRFERKKVPAKPEVALADPQTRSLWTIDGKCVDGFAKGERLAGVRVEEDVLWGTLKTFMPATELLAAEAVAAGRAVEAKEPEPAKPKPVKPVRKPAAPR
ncbi:MAG: DUF3179 domain-containing (seleno)protein [Phycisphaerae bacterium]